ncbi:MAG: metal-dependent hydrolase [bacterium]
MDSVTQIALGAAIGEAVLGKKVRNKAMLWGAIAGTIPDLDAIPGHFLNTVSRLEIHRGVTHSILFAIVLAPVLGHLVAKMYKTEKADRGDWSKLFFWGLFTHALLDAFTTWGTQLFWPFEYRVAIKSIFVVDPLYTLPLLICLIWLSVKKDGRVRRKLNAIGLGLSTLYLGLTLVNKTIMIQNFREILESKNISYSRVTTRPAPFNNLLWTANIETEAGFYICHYSFLDNSKDVPLFYYRKNHEWLAELRENDRVRRLLAITKGWYTVSPQVKGLTINDLRFGQLGGFRDGKGPFVFRYKVEYDPENPAGPVRITADRPSFENRLPELRHLWERIKGNHLPGGAR